MAFSLRARVVFPVDGVPLEHGVVTIDGARIVAVGAARQASDVTDLGDVALLPGLVNAHTHLEFSRLPRPLGEPGMRLADWVRLVIAERARAEEDAAESIAAGLAESAGRGVTTLGDISQGHSSGWPQSALDVTRLLEVIGFSQARAESAFAAVLDRLAALEGAGGARIGLSPHAPYTVSPRLLRRLIAVGSERGIPVAMHVAESAEELELLAHGTGPLQQLLVERSMWDAEAIPRGSRPLDYLRMLSEAPRALVIHGNYLDEAERSFLAAHAARMSLVYCPRTHAYFGHPAYRLTKLIATGVRVALGTDSRASNPDLDLLAEMRFVAASHAGVDPMWVLRAGTLAGAEALGRAAEVGSITAGKRADFIAIPLPSGASGKPDELAGAILAGRERPCGVWIRGKRIEQTGLV
jgi:cytosine/adenosine deaminase-related metal-dependent hydrolase